MRNVLLVFCLVFGAVLPAQAATSVFVSIVPQKYFVEKIGRDHVRVSVMVPPGASPHTYEPRPRQMSDLTTAKAYFTVGMQFERIWLKRLTSANPNMAVVQTEEGVVKRPMSDHDHDEPDHTGHNHHAEESLDPHIWLDPTLVRQQAANICRGLCGIDPEHAGEYQRNLETFLSELAELDREIRATLAPLPREQRTFLVFHPSWGYFAAAYGLHQEAIEAGGREPSPKDLARLIAKARELHAKAVFVQPQFSQKSAEVLARQINAQIVRLDPLAENWVDNLRRAADALRGGLR